MSKIRGLKTSSIRWPNQSLHPLAHLIIPPIYRHSFDPFLYFLPITPYTHPSVPPPNNKTSFQPPHLFIPSIYKPILPTTSSIPLPPTKQIPPTTPSIPTPNYETHPSNDPIYSSHQPTNQSFLPPHLFLLPPTKHILPTTSSIHPIHLQTHDSYHPIYSSHSPTKSHPSSFQPPVYFHPITCPVKSVLKSLKRIKSGARKTTLTASWPATNLWRFWRSTILVDTTAIRRKDIPSGSNAWRPTIRKVGLLCFLKRR